MAGKRGVVATHYTPRNPEKYTGTYPIVCRSSWETHVAYTFDTTESIISWASEPLSIPYSDPTRIGSDGGPKQTVYIPDFFVVYIGDDGQEHQMMIEVKPAKEALDEQAVREGDRMMLARNKAKWEAASWWCQRRGIEFRVLTEGQIFGDQQISHGHARINNPKALKSRGPKTPKLAKAPRKARAKR